MVSLNKCKVSLNELLLSLYFIYMIDPFFINAIVSIHRFVYYIVAIIPLFCVLIKSNGIIKTNKHVKAFGLIFILYSVIAFIMSAMIGGDFLYFSDYVKLVFKIVNGLSLFCIWRFLSKKHRIQKTFEEIFVNAIIIYIFSSILFLAFPAAKTFWVGFIYNDKIPMYILMEESYLTRYGLAGWSSFNEAYLMIFGCVVLISLYIRRIEGKKSFTLKMIVLMVGSFLYGRFALVIMLIILALFVLYTVIIQGKLWIFTRIMIAILFGVLLIVFMYGYSASTKAVVDWALEPLFNFLENGSFAINSTKQLSDMYTQFSPTIQEIFIGSGKWYESNGMPYKYTDVGFMRQIYFCGIFTSALLYMSDVYLIYWFAYTFKKVANKSGSYLLTIFYLVILIAADMKGYMPLTFMRYLIPLIMANSYYAKSIGVVKGDKKNG